MTQKYINKLTYKVIGCAIEVHKHLGPDLLESVYEKCFRKESALQSLASNSTLDAGRIQRFVAGC